jgi:CRAL/TRIO domain
MTSEATAGQVPDLYGQVHPIETADLIATKQKEFAIEISKLPDAETKCLKQAQSKCPELTTEEFQLWFLRCEVFNADVRMGILRSIHLGSEILGFLTLRDGIALQLAAKRYAKYWSKRVELFGEEKAFLPLTLSGALKDDTVALQAGFSFITGTDSTGRAVFVDIPAKLGACTEPRESKARVFWYLIHEALTKYEDAQKRGVLFVTSPRGAKFRHFDSKMTGMLTDSIKGCWPVRLSCIHVCRPPAFVSILLPIVKLMMGPALRKRFRFHTGSPDKIAESLESVGIPRSAFPPDLGGDFKIPA